MNISNLFQSKQLVFSLEVFPPKKTSSIDTIYNTLYGLRGIPCDFVSVTYGAGGSTTQKSKTFEMAALFRDEYNIEPVTHLTCLTSTKEEIRDILSRLKEKGVQNILALRGDYNPDVPPKNDFQYASDLVRYIKEYDPSFNVLGACYPEQHCDSGSLEEDIENLRRKVENGTSHLITQLFFDNRQFYDFMDKLVQKGITVPVSAGIMPIVNKAQIERTVSMCGASLPKKFAKMVNKYADNPAALKDAGIAYAAEQIIDLITNDVRGIHLYTMNHVEIAKRISNSIENIVKSCNQN